MLKNILFINLIFNISLIKCCLPNIPISQFDTQYLDRQCGIFSTLNSFSTNSLNRIINGDLADSNSWPWAVSLRYKSGNRFSHVCGGALVSEFYVITAAHCLINLDASKFILVIGSHFLNEPLRSDKVYYISRLKIYPQFEPKSIRNDIALIKLSRAVKFSTIALPVCLPTSNNIKLIYNKDVVVIGWGSTNGKKEKSGLSNSLLQAKLKILNSNNSNRCYGYDLINYCAVDPTSKNSNICYGDSGGPLLWFNEGKWYLYGISSFVFTQSDLCENNLPSFYTIVPKFREWILNNI